MRIHKLAERNDGSAFQDADGYLTDSTTMNEFFYKDLETIWVSGVREYFPAAILSRDKFQESNNLNCSGLRSSYLRAIAQGASVDDREIVNHWSNEKRSKKKGKRVPQPLFILFADQTLLNECF